MKPLSRWAGILSLLWLVALAGAAAPSQPQNLQQAFLDTFESLLLWDDVPGATGYNIYRADESNGWTLVSSSVTVTLA
jgi:hypothetical protein